MKKYFSASILVFAFSFLPHANAATTMQDMGLVGSTWTGDGKSGDGILTYVFHFNQDGLSLESTCHVAEFSSTLKAELAVIYTENGNAVELQSGVQSTIPAGQGSCTVNFPVGLKFELEHDQIYIEFDGTRRLTQMKRQNSSL